MRAWRLKSLDYSESYNKDYSKGISMVVFNFTSKIKHDTKKQIHMTRLSIDILIVKYYIYNHQ